MGSGPNWHTNYTTAPQFTVNDIGNFSSFEIKVQAVNEKGEGPEPDPVIGYPGEDGKIFLKWFFQQYPSISLEICLLCILSHLTPSCLSLSLSSIGGSNGCGCYTNEQHYHQSDLGKSRQRDGQRTPTGIQGTDPVSPLLVALTYSAPVLMNNTYFTAEAARSSLGEGFRVLFSFKVVKNKALFYFR